MSRLYYADVKVRVYFWSAYPAEVHDAATVHAAEELLGATDTSTVTVEEVSADHVPPADWTDSIAYGPNVGDTIETSVKEVIEALRAARDEAVGAAAREAAQVKIPFGHAGA